MKLFFPLLLVISNLCYAFSSTATCDAAATGGSGAHVPVGRDGEGQYSASTKGCFDVIHTATPLILREIELQTLRSNGSDAYHIADYGTADAGTSLGLMTKMVDAVRKKQKDKEVVLHYEDQLT